MQAMVADWRGVLKSAIAEAQLRGLREHGRTGCPLGSVSLVAHLSGSSAELSAREKQVVY